MLELLIITRIYSGMEDSFRTKVWQPKGMPAYYKLIEELSKQNDMEVDAICLGKMSHRGVDRLEGFRFSGLKINFYVFPYVPVKIFKLFGSKLYTYLSGMINEVFHFFYSIKMVSRKKYDLIYIDRANIVIGGFLATFLNKKVVVRFFGVALLNRRMAGIKKWVLEPFKYLSYKAPFSYVICSKDGSGGRYFFEEYLNKETPYEILLNGVDKTGYTAGSSNIVRTKYAVPEHAKIILFLSRLDERKGLDLFIKSLRTLSETNRNFLVIIVGDGPLRRQLEYMVRERGLSDLVKFEGAVEHDITYSYYNAADIYVSLSSIANLSNTVLEAMSAGKCIVTFAKDVLDKTDYDTEEILSGKAVLINKRRAAEELPLALDDLLKNDQKIREFSESARELAGKILKSWDDRISYEISLFERISTQKKGRT